MQSHLVLWSPGPRLPVQDACGTGAAGAQLFDLLCPAVPAAGARQPGAADVAVEDMAQDDVAADGGDASDAAADAMPQERGEGVVCAPVLPQADGAPVSPAMVARNAGVEVGDQVAAAGDLDTGSFHAGDGEVGMPPQAGDTGEGSGAVGARRADDPAGPWVQTAVSASLPAEAHNRAYPASAAAGLRGDRAAWDGRWSSAPMPATAQGDAAEMSPPTTETAAQAPNWRDASAGPGREGMTPAAGRPVALDGAPLRTDRAWVEQPPPLAGRARPAVGPLGAPEPSDADGATAIPAVDVRNRAADVGTARTAFDVQPSRPAATASDTQAAGPVPPICTALTAPAEAPPVARPLERMPGDAVDRSAAASAAPPLPAAFVSAAGAAGGRRSRADDGRAFAAPEPLIAGARIQPGPGAALPDPGALVPLAGPAAAGVVRPDPGLPAMRLPAPVHRQLADAIVTSRDDAIEIILSPDELGRVKVVIGRDDHVTRLNIMAERPATLDLVRRHADLLTRELRDSGVGQSDISFATPDGRGHGGQGRGSGRDGPAAADAPVQRGEPPRDRVVAADRPAPVRAPGDRRIDIRI